MVLNQNNKYERRSKGRYMVIMKPIIVNDSNLFWKLEYHTIAGELISAKSFSYNHTPIYLPNPTDFLVLRIKENVLPEKTKIDN